MRGWRVESRNEETAGKRVLRMGGCEGHRAAEEVEKENKQRQTLFGNTIMKPNTLFCFIFKLYFYLCVCILVCVCINIRM